MNFTLMEQSLCILGVISGPGGPHITKQFWSPELGLLVVRLGWATTRSSRSSSCSLWPLIFHWSVVHEARLGIFTTYHIIYRHTIKHTNICHTEPTEKWFTSELWLPEHQLGMNQFSKLGLCVPSSRVIRYKLTPTPLQQMKMILPPDSLWFWNHNWKQKTKMSLLGGKRRLLKQSVFQYEPGEQAAQGPPLYPKRLPCPLTPCLLPSDLLLCSALEWWFDLEWWCRWRPGKRDLSWFCQGL